ncbi:glycosyltransferase family 2 protein [Chitinivibrio alkaliphilus]|uniref:Glycosyl transferase, family 2 n=1 Tax=Chitinivibrio alkaliphilus ACht1 TaxID=1313304 RepID=U7DDZ8_9BACT|nr:glycosyltransferase family 2 protein [Chitinivibrio alkaliphilus]ERP39136.1 glycosyl transferase, family 2 [Chitinivibrio alkaliphilus ACht1]
MSQHKGTPAILIPAYRAEKELRTFIPQLLEFYPAQHIYVVNDGITDATQALCSSLGIVCFSHTKNRGKGAALRTGFFHLVHHYEWVITMDADGQHRPSDIPHFLYAILHAPAHCALIFGVRNMSFGQMPILRMLSNKLTSLALSLLCMRFIEDSQCGFRAYNLPVFMRIHTRFRKFEFESEVLLRLRAAQYEVDSVPVKTVYIEDGPSHISHLTDTLRWIFAVGSTKISLLWNS